MKTEQRLY